MSEDRPDAKLLTRLAETYSTPDSEAWAVHGDLLQGSGDPRGEIIALEQRQQREGGARLQPTIKALYNEHAASWVDKTLAKLLDNQVGKDWITRLDWHHGYLRGVQLSLFGRDKVVLNHVLQSPVAIYLRSLQLTLYERWLLPEIVKQIAARPLTLWRLVLTLNSAFDKGRSLGPAACQRLVDATPALRALSLNGRRMLDALAHDRLRHLTLSGHDAIVGFGEPGVVDLPALTSLDLSPRHTERLWQGPEAELDPGVLLSGNGVAGVRSLDLSRDRRHSYDVEQVPWALSHASFYEAPLLRRISTLVLPPFYSAEQVRRCVESAARIAHLRVNVPVVLSYHVDPSAALKAALPSIELGFEYPHQPAAEISKWVVWFSCPHDDAPDGGDTVMVSLKDLCQALEDSYERLAASSRSTLGELVERYMEIDDEADDEADQTLSLPAPPLRQALHDVRDLTEIEPKVQQVVELLERHAHCCSTVLVEKVWGW